MPKEIGQYLTTQQMREADRRAIEELGIPGAVLMENAGRAIYAEIEKGPLGVVCGKGNNGGDGFVVARHALLDGMRTTVLLLGKPEELKGDAALNYKIFRRLGGAVTSLGEGDDVAGAVSGLDDCHTVLDAMLGTGVKGQLKGMIAQAVEAWPSVNTVAVDIPTGMNGDTGAVEGPCIRADVTVTMHAAKEGFRNPEAAQYLGRLVIADIGIPAVCEDDEAWETVKKNLDELRD